MCHFSAVVGMILMMFLFIGCRSDEKGKVKIERFKGPKVNVVFDFESPISSYFEFKRWVKRSLKKVNKKGLVTGKSIAENRQISSSYGIYRTSGLGKSLEDNPYWKMGLSYEKSGRYKSAYEEYKRLYYYCKAKSFSRVDIERVLEKLVDLAYKLEYWQEGAKWERELYQQR